MNDYESDLRSIGPGLLESVWRYRFLVVGVALLTGLAGFLYAVQQQPVYEAQSRLLLSDPRTSGLFGELRAGVADTNRYVRNQVEFILTGAVYPTASELIDGRWTASEISELVLAETEGDTDLIRITAIDDAPEDAAELADAVSEAYQIVVAQQVRAAARDGVEELEQRNELLRGELRELRAADPPAAADPPDAADPPEGNDPALEAERDAALAQIAQNESRIQQLTVDAALFGSGVEIAAPAAVPLEPARPHPRRSATLGFLMGFVLAAGVAWWRNSTSQVASRSADPAATLRAPLLGEIPEFSKVGVPGNLPAVSAPLSAAGEAYQFVMSSLMLALDHASGKVILVTSARPGDGKTVSAANLALTALRDDREVVMIDADKRVMGLSRLLRVDTDSGVTPARLENLPVHCASTVVKLAHDVEATFVSIGLDVDDAAGYFRTTAFRRTMDWVRQQGDLVILDTPPLLAVSDTSAIASQVDGIVLVVDRGTPMVVLEEVHRRLEFIGTPLIGYIFNRAQGRSSVYGYVGKEYGDGRGDRWRAEGYAGPIERPEMAKSVASPRTSSS